MMAGVGYGTEGRGGEWVFIVVVGVAGVIGVSGAVVVAGIHRLIIGSSITEAVFKATPAGERSIKGGVVAVGPAVA